MIRIEITRRIGAKQGRGRNRISPVIVSHEPTADEALARIAAIRDAGEALAPGYMPILSADLYDGDAFLAWVKAGGPAPKPFRVLDAAAVAALPAAAR